MIGLPGSTDAGLSRRGSAFFTVLVSLVLLLLLVLVLVTVVIPLSAPPRRDQPVAQAGVLDLQDWDFEVDGAVNLRGEWQFSRDGVGDSFIAVPGYWNNVVHGGERLSGMGFGTYSLLVLLPERSGGLAINGGFTQTAYTLFANGKQVAQAGVPGGDRLSSVPGYAVKIGSVPAATGESGGPGQLSIVMHISNFHHRQGGVWVPPVLGNRDDLVATRYRAVQLEVFLMAVIGTIGLYYAGFFIYRRQERSSLYFSIYCFLVVVRTLVTGQLVVNELLPGVPWGVLLKVEYLTFYGGVVVFLMYFASVFPGELPRKALRVLVGLGTLFSVVVLVTPARIYTWTVQPFQFITFAAGVVLIGGLIGAIRHRRNGALILSVASIVFFGAVANDLLYANQLVETAYLLPAGFLIFVLSQAFLLTRRLTGTVHLAEVQSEQLRDVNETLRHNNRQLELSRTGLVVGMAKLAESRDNDTGAHLQRIREYSRILAQQLSDLPQYVGYITQGYIVDLCHSAILHDIGKVGVPDAILLKPGPLTTEEFEVIKRHPIIGGETIASVEATVGVQSFLTMARQIALAHHEKWDGSGYPRGLVGEDIPLSARVVALADVYDALTSVRPYKKAMTHEEARAIILDGRGRHFDPDVVDAFVARDEEFRSIMETLQDSIELEGVGSEGWS